MSRVAEDKNEMSNCVGTFHEQDPAIGAQRREPVADYGTAISSGECPLWVNNGHRTELRECLLYPQKQTSLSTAATSALCQKRTFEGAFPSALTLVFTNKQTL